MSSVGTAMQNTDSQTLCSGTINKMSPVIAAQKVLAAVLGEGGRSSQSGPQRIDFKISSQYSIYLFCGNEIFFYMYIPPTTTYFSTEK